MASGTTIVAKIATSLLTNENSRKPITWILGAIFAPSIFVIVVLLSLISGGSSHNNLAVDMSFFGGEISENTPTEYVEFIENMQADFKVIDSEIAEINQMTENGNGLDSTRIKSVFIQLHSEATLDQKNFRLAL